jgi:hypothetical protein
MKRILWLVTVILSIVFLVLSLAGIPGVWMARASSQRLVNNVFGSAEHARAGASSRVAEGIAERQALRTGLDGLSIEVEKFGRQLESTPVVFLAIDQLLDGKLAPTLTELDLIGRQVYADLSNLDTAVTTLNNISIFSQRQGVLDDFELFLERLLTDIEKTEDDFRALERALRERKAETIQAITTPSQMAIAQMDEDISESQARWQDMQGVLDQLQLELEASRTDALRLITLLAVLLTAVLAWLAFSHLLAARYAWNAYQQLETPRDAGSSRSEPSDSDGHSPNAVAKAGA